MDLAAKRSALLQNKFVMRLGCVLVAVVFLVSSVLTPRARAVAGVDDAAVVGSMALASYLSATGVNLTVIEGGAGAVSAGMGALAGEYAAATGAAASGGAVLEGIAAGTALSAAGTIVLTAAAVAACAALGYWIYTTYFADAEADTPVSIYSNSGVVLLDGSSIIGYVNGGFEKATKFSYNVTYTTVTGHTFRIDLPGDRGGLSFYVDGELLKSGTTCYSFSNYVLSNFYPGSSMFTVLHCYDTSLSNYGDIVMNFNDSLSFSDFFGDEVTHNMTAFVPENYAPPEILPNQGMRINIGADPGTTPEELPDIVPAKILQGDFAPSYELEAPTPTLPSFPGEGQEGEGPEDVDDLGLPSLGEALTRRFPFSIPWDIARGITLLAAPAKAPYFEVDFYEVIGDRVGGWKGSTKLVLDFSEYEILGKLSRWTSTIGFCLFLASATKRFIWTA